jgi:CDP-diacylglycerol--glycerol-3-phosphate 3-phosphatidyltransferase
VSTPRTAGAADRWKQEGRDRVRGWLKPVAQGLARTGVSPDVLTLGGLLLTLIGSVEMSRGRFTLGAVWAIAGSLLDALDGPVARERGKGTAFGAFLDSTVDRVSDTLLFLGVSAYYFYLPVLTASTLSGLLESKYLGMQPVNDWLTGLSGLLALAGAYMVSYTRARAEGLGLECKVGWFERPERLIVLLGAALFGVGVWMEYALLFLAIMSWITVVQRILYVRRRLADSSPRAGRSAL